MGQTIASALTLSTSSSNEAVVEQVRKSSLNVPVYHWYSNKKVVYITENLTKLLEMLSRSEMLQIKRQSCAQKPSSK